MIKKAEPTKSEEIQISPPKMVTTEFKIRGTTPYMQQRFSQKMAILQTQLEGKKKAGGKKIHEPKDLAKLLEAATYFMQDGSYGIPASAFRAAMISACRLVNFKMTLAKLSLFVIADGVDRNDGDGLVKLTGKREQSIMTVRLPSSGAADVRIRPIWHKWEAKVKVTFDSTQFSLTDVGNLFLRVGSQIGLGEGRPDSRDSAGLGYGLFEVV